MTDAPMTFVCGMRGMGKSTRVKELLRSRRRVVVFDPMGEYAKAGFRRVEWSDIGGVLKRAGRSKGFKISYVPRANARPDALHRLSLGLIEFQQAVRGERILLVVEEMSFSFPSEKLPAHLWGFKEMCLTGRHSDIEVIGIFQRPALVSTTFTGNCEDRYIFRLDEAADLDRIAKTIRRENVPQLAALGPHEYLRYHLGKITRGKNSLKK